MLLRPGQLTLVELQAIHAGGHPLLVDPTALRGIEVSAAVVRYLPRVPATTALPDALSRLRQHNSHLALVTDAGGAVCAMVTLEDLVEDLVGTVRDGTHHS